MVTVITVCLESQIRVIILLTLSVVVRLQVHNLLSEEKPPLLLCVRKLVWQ